MKNPKKQNLGRNENATPRNRLVVRLGTEHGQDFDPQLTVSLTSLKQSLLEPLLKEAHSAVLRLRLRWAAEDAAALAFLTPLPCLFFPALLSEQVVKAHQWVERQQAIRRRNRTRNHPSDPKPSKATDRREVTITEALRSGIQQHAA